MGFFQQLAVAEAAPDRFTLSGIIVQLGFFPEKMIFQLFNRLTESLCPVDILVIADQKNVRFQKFEPFIEFLIFSGRFGFLLQGFQS